MKRRKQRVEEAPPEIYILGRRSFGFCLMGWGHGAYNAWDYQTTKGTKGEQ